MSMRRCPHCRAANPGPAQFCHQCGGALPYQAPVPFFVAADWFSPATLKAALPPLAGLLVFRLSFGAWLSATPPREELRFVAFHLWHGLLLGLALASTRLERTRGAWLAWTVAGLLGGVLAEGLEIWFTYKHVMQTISFYVADWFGVTGVIWLPYRILQGLRLLGVLGPLVACWAWFRRPTAGAGLAAFSWLLLALGLRAFVKGAFLTWPGLWTALGLENTLLYGVSALCILLALGREKLDGPGRI
jgi:hypothetical protein